MPLGVGGSTPFAMATNHPTAYNHSFRDTVGYDPKKQSRMKCTYCGCWARKGELCYQCKQPTGPLVLPRRNGYRVEPLVGTKGFPQHYNESYTTNNSGSQSDKVVFSPRQMERLRTASSNGGTFSYEHITKNEGSISPRGSTTQPSALRQRTASAPNHRFYQPGPAHSHSEVFAEQLRNHVASQQRQQADREQEMIAEGRGRNTTEFDEAADVSEEYMYNKKHTPNQQKDVNNTTTNSGGINSSRRSAGAVTITSSHKGVTGGYFYHDEQTALGHKFREESHYDPSKQTKVKCRYCGCWAKKGAACGLCRIVNKV